MLECGSIVELLFMTCHAQPVAATIRVTETESPLSEHTIQCQRPAAVVVFTPSANCTPLPLPIPAFCLIRCQAKQLRWYPFRRKYNPRQM